MEVTGAVNVAEKFPAGLPPEPEQDAFIKDACTRMTDAYLAPIQLRSTTLTLIYSTISLPSWSAGSHQVSCSIGATLGNGGWSTLLNSAKGPLQINGQPPIPPPDIPEERLNFPPIPMPDDVLARQAAALRPGRRASSQQRADQHGSRPRARRPRRLRRRPAGAARRSTFLNGPPPGEAPARGRRPPPGAPRHRPRGPPPPPESHRRRRARRRGCPPPPPGPAPGPARRARDPPPPGL